MLRDAFLYRLARGIPLTEGVLLPLQSKVRTPSLHLRCIILRLQILLNVSLPPVPLHSNEQSILHLPRRLPAVVAQQHSEEPQCVTFYPAQQSAFLSLQLLLAVLKTYRPPSLIQKPAQSLRIHSESELSKTIRDRGSDNCNRR
jgi:hypothetical protein